MTERDLLDAIGMLPQDMLAEGLPKQEKVSAADDSKPAVRRIKKDRENPNIMLRLGAVAAAFCLVASGAVIYGAVRMQKSGKMQTPLTSELSEQTQPGQSKHRYVTLMQEYDTAANGTPCTYDFTGMGADLSESWEVGDYTVTMKAIAGDAFQLYYFYDITLKEGAEWGAVMPVLNISADYSEEQTGFPFGNWGKNLTDNHRMLSEEPGVRHMAGVLQDVVGFGFQAAEIHAHVSESEISGETGDSRAVACDFITAPHYTEIFDPENRLTVDGNPLRRAAVTRLGVYFTESDINTYDYGTAEIFVDNRSNSIRFFAVPEECEAWQMALIPTPYADNIITLAPRTADGIMRHITNEQSGESMTTLLLPFAEPLTESSFLNGYLSVNGCRIALGSPLPDFISAYEQNAKDTQNYVSLMQEYYSKQKMNGAPCNFDFTGMGMDYEETLRYEDEAIGGFTIRIRAFAGDALTLHCFYDVIPDDPANLAVSHELRHPEISLEIADRNGEPMRVYAIASDWISSDTAADGNLTLHEHIAVMSADGVILNGASAKLIAAQPLHMSYLCSVESSAVPLRYLTEAPAWYRDNGRLYLVSPLAAYCKYLVPGNAESKEGCPVTAAYRSGETAETTADYQWSGEADDCAVYAFRSPLNRENPASLTLDGSGDLKPTQGPVYPDEDWYAKEEKGHAGTAAESESSQTEEADSQTDAPDLQQSEQSEDTPEEAVNPAATDEAS